MYLIKSLRIKHIAADCYVCRPFTADCGGAATSLHLNIGKDIRVCFEDLLPLTTGQIVYTNIT